jgi:hypothetical protein
VDFDAVLEEDEDGIWAVSVPALPGCFWLALRPLPFRQVRKALASLGFHPTRQRGSHVTFQHTDGRSVTVPPR